MKQSPWRPVDSCSGPLPVWVVGSASRNGQARWVAPSWIRPGSCSGSSPSYACRSSAPPALSPGTRSAYWRTEPEVRGHWHEDVITSKRFPYYWTFVRGSHRSVDSHHKGPVMRSFCVNKLLNKQWLLVVPSQSGSNNYIHDVFLEVSLTNCWISGQVAGDVTVMVRVMPLKFDFSVFPCI